MTTHFICFYENYIKFMESEFKDRFSCSYIFDDKPVHSKVYTWLRDETPVKAFMGSCNYSQAAFIKNTQKEIAYECDAKKAHDYFLSNIPTLLKPKWNIAVFTLPDLILISPDRFFNTQLYLNKER